MNSTQEPPPLEGRTVLVAGASGGIGEGMTLGLLQQGAVVVAAGRDAARLRRVSDYADGCGPGTLHTQVIDVADSDSAAVRRELTERYGLFDGAVISIGNWGPPRRAGILDTTDEVWDEMIADNLTSHFRALRAVTPLIAPNGALVHLSGFSAEIPYPGAALVGATNAAKKSLLRSLTAELDGQGPRTYELVIGPIRTRPRAALGADSPAWLTALELGHHAGRLVAGLGPWADEPLQYLLDRASGVHTTVPL
ncbi:SDR family oxidoreductase [Streptomyces montanus]|uniref:SDR family oxidoreductase n=1 Tax=Streptomyces montanus TaxID=2580423 RepID=A0A5R9G3A7_9ACTN|nr:SDR family oxidoreductase [Streptomyces montanus]TLS47373.1 SDR family oxidoreductase [Streptomyces montanus]